MLRDNFKYDGPNPAMKELVDTINQMAKLWNGFSVDMGGNGGLDVVRTDQMPDGFRIDLSKVLIPEETPPA